MKNKFVFEGHVLSISKVATGDYRYRVYNKNRHIIFFMTTYCCEAGDKIRIKGKLNQTGGNGLEFDHVKVLKRRRGKRNA